MCWTLCWVERDARKDGKPSGVWGIWKGLCSIGVELTLIAEGNCTRWFRREYKPCAILPNPINGKHGEPVSNHDIWESNTSAIAPACSVISNPITATVIVRIAFGNYPHPTYILYARTFLFLCYHYLFPYCGFGKWGIIGEKFWVFWHGRKYSSFCHVNE